MQMIAEGKLKNNTKIISKEYGYLYIYGETSTNVSNTNSYEDITDDFTLRELIYANFEILEDTTEEIEPKYTYCIIKYNELYLKEFSLYTRVDCENNEVYFDTNFIFTSDYNQANKFKIRDAHYIVTYLREGATLKYIY